MVNPIIQEEKPLALADVKAILEAAEKRDQTLNFLSNKAKAYVETFIPLTASKKAELYKKLTGLNLIRLKEEHLCKIIDFLPKDTNELKIVLQAYPLNLPKKDQDSIIEVVAGFVK